MPPVPSAAAATKSVLLFIKAGNSRSQPGFGHALKLSYNLMAKERLTVTNNNKTLTYRYHLSDDVPKATVGLFTALMDELSTNACFAAGLPSPPGVSLQMQTELLVNVGTNAQEFLLPNEIEIVNTVTKLGRTVSHTRTDFYCAATRKPLAFSSHVKYMPTGSRLLDFVLSNKRIFGWYEKWYHQRLGKQVPVYEEKHLIREVLGSSLEYTNAQQGRFHITREHTNPFGAMHGGCHAMVMEQAGATFAQSELELELRGNTSNSSSTQQQEKQGVVLEAMQVEFIGAAKGTVDVYCETIGHVENVIHVRVLLKKGERICSEGKLRFSKRVQ